MSDLIFKRLSWFIILFAFLVVAAGAIVRMTHSGMGCPDWPTCFGKWIPPLSADQLPDNYRDYLDKQDIDEEFNAVHTWIEYLNRLIGALLGLLILVYTVFTFRRKSNLTTKLLVLALLFTVGFTGWLGKLVVDNNLAVVKITLHMLTAIIIIVLPLFMLRSSNLIHKVGINKRILYVLNILISAALVQILLGTQVRQQIDDIAKLLNYGQRTTWITQLDNWFIVHRSFSWLLAVGTFYMVYALRYKVYLRYISLSVLFVVMFSVFLGISLNYFGFPRFAQPLHLLSSFMLVMCLVYLRLSIYTDSNDVDKLR